MIGNLKPHAAYKDSGHEWLGSTPAHWGLLRAKRVFREADERSRTGKEELLSVSHLTGVTPHRLKAELTEPYFGVDPVFRGPPVRSTAKGVPKYHGVTYAERYELLCRRLVLERMYNASCFMMATNATPTIVTQPAPDLTFARFAAALRGHAVTFVGSQAS